MKETDRSFGEDGTMVLHKGFCPVIGSNLDDPSSIGDSSFLSHGTYTGLELDQRKWSTRTMKKI